MADAASGKAFYEGAGAIADEFFVQLDLDDRPVVITATFTQSDALGLTCSQTVSRRVKGYRRIVLPPSCDRGAYKPKRYVIACGDANFRLEHLRWRRWNRSVAKARGLALANDCIPVCAGGTFHSYSVKVRASRIRRCPYDDDRYRYTRLRITYAGARPSGSPRRVSVRVVCPS
jgi:hypothetical protein